MNRRYNQAWCHNNKPNRSSNQVKTCERPWNLKRFCLHLWRLARTLARCIMRILFRPCASWFIGWEFLKACSHMIADDRRSKISDRRIVFPCDRRRSQNFCDLRSAIRDLRSAIVCDYYIWKPALNFHLHKWVTILPKLALRQDRTCDINTILLALKRIRTWSSRYFMTSQSSQWRKTTLIFLSFPSVKLFES